MSDPETPAAEVCARRPLATPPVAAVALSDATGDVWLARETVATVALRDASAVVEVPTC